MNLALVASIAALGLGPLVHERTRGRWAVAAVDAFALTAVAGLVALHIVPQSFVLAGWIALPALLLGLFGPGLLCGTRLLSDERTGKITLPLALLGIALHAVLDGVALSSDADPRGGEMLALAVVLHRIADGLGIWWLARPRYGPRVALLLLLTLAVFSVLGFLFAEPIARGATSAWFGFFQALIAGSLLHVILRHPPSVARSAPGVAPGGEPRVAIASGVAGLLGIALVLLLGIWVAGGEHAGAPMDASGDAPMDASGDGSESALALFLELAWESAPALLGAYLAVAALHVLALDLRSALGRGGTLGQALRGTVIGLPMPICSCGVIPLYRSLIEQRVPTAAALSFLVAAPELGMTAILLSWGLLGAKITLARAAAAGLLALVVGLLVGPRAPVPARVLEGAPGERPPERWFARLRAGIRYGLVDMVDATAPWILAGLGLAALLGPVLDAERFALVSPALQVPLFALLGMPLYVCASGSTPLAAVLIANGISPGAVIAFLLTGPATNVTTFGVLARMHSRKTAAFFIVTVALTTMAIGWSVDAYFSRAPAAVPARLQEHAPNVLQIVSAVALLALFAHSLLRQGTRRFLDPVLSPYGESEHGHDHAHDDDAEGAACAAP